MAGVLVYRNTQRGEICVNTEAEPEVIYLQTSEKTKTASNYQKLEERQGIDRPLEPSEVKPH